METTPKFITTSSIWKDINEKLYQDCEDFLVDTLLNEENNEVSFTEDEDDEEYMTSVTYKCANHPEYTINLYSLVKRVYLKDNAVFLEIEEDDQYSISMISAAELSDVASSVYDLINNKKHNQNGKL